MPSKTGRPVPYMDEVALNFPELRIVAGQLGLSPEVEAQFLYENARRVFKLS
jgi:predicted TIM-barrel fold metal-dependent hydrolase